MRKLLHHEINRWGLSEVKNCKKHPIVVALHNIRSLYNVGSIFRTSDAAGIETLLLCGYTGSPPRKEIDKTALGSTESVTWYYYPDIKNAIQEYREKGYQIVALEITDQAKLIHELVSSDFPLFLIIGNEITGIDDDILSVCDRSLVIPQYGFKHSLNVSVAYGIAIFQLAEQFRKVANPEDIPPLPQHPPESEPLDDCEYD